MNDYLFGKGRVALAERDANGAVSEILYLGNCPELKISGTADRLDHYESETGTNQKDRSIVKTSALEMSVTLESMTDDNLALLLWGATRDLAALTAQSHYFPEGLTDGKIHVIPNGFNLDNAVLKDSTLDMGDPDPQTVDVADYDLNTAFGTIQFLNIEDVGDAYVQPLYLEYDRGAAQSVPFMTTLAPTRFLRFEGLNLGNPGINVSQKFIVELYIVQFDPVTDLSLIGDDFGKFELKGGLQQDDTRITNDDLGGFGRIIKLPAGI